MLPASLTDEQRAAIETRDVSIGLSAGAGCGKTSVLTHRYISHLQPAGSNDDATRLSQLIAITFTDAAAREMRSRIRRACHDQLAAASAPHEQAHWQRLLREIDTARVSTIHAFCASLLRANAAAAGLDPLFGVLDQTDAYVLQIETIDDVLRQQLDAMHAETLELVDAYGFNTLKQQISTLLACRHDESFQRWLDATVEELLDGWRRWHQDDGPRAAAGEIAASTPARRLLHLLRDPATLPQTAKFAAARETLLRLLSSLRDGNVTASQLEEISTNARVKGICTPKDWPSPADQEAYGKTCTELRKTIEKHGLKPFDSAALRPTAQLALALLRLTTRVADQYDERKRAQGKLDFDDLLFSAHQFLADPKNDTLRSQLADNLRLLLVDEFQDTDRLQARLVRLLCGDHPQNDRLFFVGDFKQSIYRFRGAVPSVFHEMRSDIGKKGQLKLTLNFRSQPGVLNFVNAIFHDTFDPHAGQYEPLRPSRPPVIEPCVEFLWTLAPDKRKHVAGSVLQARRQEARNIARRLRGLIDNPHGTLPVVDQATGAPRPLALGDVAILFRALSDVQVYEEALREYDLDYYLVGGHAFYAQQEIYDVLNLLRAVASTADDVSLAGALRSPFFALEDETLFWLADSAGGLNAGLLAQRLPPQLSEPERAKVRFAADTLRHLRAMKDRLPIATLLREALDRTGYDAVLLAEFLGQRKLANLHKLMESARAADRGNVLDLDGFITQLAQFTAREPKEALAATLPEEANVIRLMTIHHAKGLEFPCVVLADMDRAPNFGAIHAALHPEFGPLVRTPEAADNEQAPSADPMRLHCALEKIQELEERKRMLYVACTRAADYLILSSSLEDYQKPCSDWMQLLAKKFDLHTGQLTASLPNDYAAPSIHVATEPATDHTPAPRPRGPDLLKRLEQAHQLAGEGHATLPAEINPIPADNTARRQFSFSQLTGRLIRHEPEDTARPDERVPAPPAPAETAAPRTLGTLVHQVLARIDFSDPHSIAEWSEHLASQLVFPDAAAAAKNATELIQNFAASARGKQLSSAAAVHREVEFILAWPPGEKTQDPVYLRGFIDCLYQDHEGSWHLADYKTDNVTPDEVADRAQNYAMQLYVYAMAAERALGQPPAQLVLHFLRPGREHVFPWNDDSRRDAVEKVTAAIAAARVGQAF